MQKMNILLKKNLLFPKKKNSFFTLPYSTLNPNNIHLLFDRQQLKCMKNTMKKFLTPQTENNGQTPIHPSQSH